LKREIITTQDGSKTIQITEWNEQYHSKHGAIQEANYVYLDKGLQYFITENEQKSIQNVSILEIGFGTGLNAFLTLLQAEKLNISMEYVGVEAYPIASEELQALNYVEELQEEDNASIFETLHSCSWETQQQLTEYFNLKKEQKLFLEIVNENCFDVVYFDAFGPRVQPELWTEAIFNTMYKALKPKGVLVTYCAQGHARRAMISAGFTVEKLEGPPGKRHMLRAVKK
jgi:tRNA U34 5-methylaminomethyl-2-thiouridine-forming methyltransferase MnmC